MYHINTYKFIIYVPILLYWNSMHSLDIKNEVKLLLCGKNKSTPVHFLASYPSLSRLCTFQLGNYNSKWMTLSFQKRYLMVPLSYSTSSITYIKESKPPVPHSALLFIIWFSLFEKAPFLPFSIAIYQHEWNTPKVAHVSL